MKHSISYTPENIDFITPNKNTLKHGIDASFDQSC